MWIKKGQFIAQFLEMLRKRLDKELPDEDFETNYIEKSCDIVSQNAGHLKGAVEE